MVAPLAPDMPPDAALRQIVAECRTDLLKYRTLVLQSRRAIGIHQTRVALRRLRAALTLFRDAVPGPVQQRLVRSMAAEARWLAGECGPSRDLYVFMTESLQEPPLLVKRIANRLARSHLDRAREALAGARFAAFEEQLAAFIEAPSSTTGRLDEFAREMLEKRHGKVERRGRKLASLDTEQLHRLRIAIKKLRYASGFLRAAFPTPDFDSRAMNAYIDATARLQNALGALNDREVAAHMLADIAAAARPTEPVEPELRRLRKQVAAGSKRRRRRIEEAWKAFRKIEPFWRAPSTTE
ncbi:CHAD domain-containing protein [Enhydrobacter aerosaccus]|uniref:CHAD domain-containing protein n=1 Tax=Enhydrobacter aerosaccus TaxID=225324 RepID=A0A1T4SV25_9HYPH|nr:CHAD domain-containing protein [Enhydrobacter aerosaccus]SKA32043.1 CHAD domain-containing protein [Enhydrobacter aerosaccus]